MTKKTEKKPKKSKPQQLRIKGTERIDGIKEIDSAAAAYLEVRDQRMELTSEEADKKAILMGLVKKHGIELYKFEDEEGQQYDVKYEQETEENVTVRKAKVPKADKGGE